MVSDMKLELHQSWIEAWTRPMDWTLDGASTLGPWLRSRPESIRPLLLRFPPSCIVAPLRSLLCPAPGTCGIVAGYLIPRDDLPSGALAVRQSPHSEQRVICEPTWLVPIDYWRGLTPEVVASLLESVL
jgi:hypothetical protein